MAAKPSDYCTAYHRHKCDDTNTTDTRRYGVFGRTAGLHQDERCHEECGDRCDRIRGSMGRAVALMYFGEIGRKRFVDGQVQNVA